MKRFLRELGTERAVLLGFCIGGTLAFGVKVFDGGRALGYW